MARAKKGRKPESNGATLGFEHKNPALGLLRKLINDEITLRARTNIVQPLSFAEMLERSIRQYQNPAIDTVEVITELIELARELRDTHRRGEQLSLGDH